MKCNVSDRLYIDRTAAIMTAMDYDGNGNAQDASQDIASALSEIPTADVAPVVRGRWEREEDTYFGFTDVEYRCSQCGKAYSEQDFCAFHFCPICGADMREDIVNDKGN